MSGMFFGWLIFVFASTLTVLIATIYKKNITVGVFICCTIGAIPAFLSSMTCFIPDWGQLIIFGVVFCICISTFWPIMMQNVLNDRIEKQEAMKLYEYGLTLDTIHAKQKGRVWAFGKEWDAKSKDGSPIYTGEKVIVKRVQNKEILVVDKLLNTNL